ncbi:MAG: hypothetical protein ACOWWM_08510 [Desulfobacterales bacterium]
MEEGRSISRKEQSCISNCIFRWWGNREDPTDPDLKEEKYEQCLTDCRICG